MLPAMGVTLTRTITPEMATAMMMMMMLYGMKKSAWIVKRMRQKWDIQEDSQWTLNLNWRHF